jgi:hypothetical protein
MNWTAPKTDWTPPDGVLDSDMNEIGENLVTLHGGNGQDSLTTVNPDVSTHLDINTTDETFIVDDNTYNVGLILSIGRLPGNKIIIINKSGDTLGYLHEATPSGDYKAIKTDSGIGYGQHNETATILVFDGTDWFIVGNFL